MNEFYKKITEWLLPKGYTEVYKNHPSSKDREFHFSKDGIRVICVLCTYSNEDYCYVHKDILKQPYNLGLETGKFEIGTDKLEEIHEFIKSNSELIQ